MPLPEHWRGKPFFPVSSFYRQRFGARVRKLPVSLADTCPNRLGLKGMQTCVFCDVWGSAAYAEQQGVELQKQIEEKLVPMAERYSADAFLVYFQAYTSSFLAVKKLRAAFDAALAFPQVRGLVVGTRPDCLSTAVIDLWREYHARGFLSVELGVQTFDDEALRFLRRGHDAECSRAAIARIRREADVDLGIHLMFGLPGETDESVIGAARECSALPIDHVKLHNLHVLKDTPLAEMYARGEFQPIDLATYADRVILFLQHLTPRISVQRLVALSSRWDELIAPDWTRHKLGSTQFILDRMRDRGAFQGQLWSK